MVDKNVIFMNNVGATQELARRNDAMWKQVSMRSCKPSTAVYLYVVVTISTVFAHACKLKIKALSYDSFYKRGGCCRLLLSCLCHRQDDAVYRYHVGDAKDPH